MLQIKTEETLAGKSDKNKPLKKHQPTFLNAEGNIRLMMCEFKCSPS